MFDTGVADLSNIAILFRHHPEVALSDLQSLCDEVTCAIVINRQMRTQSDSDQHTTFDTQCKRIRNRFDLNYQFSAMRALRDIGDPLPFDESVLSDIQNALSAHNEAQLESSWHSLLDQVRRLRWWLQVKIDTCELSDGLEFWSMKRGVKHIVRSTDNAGEKTEQLNSKCRIEIRDGWICLDGKQQSNDRAEVAFVEVLINSRGYITQAEMVETNDTLSNFSPEKLNRDIRDKLPPEVRVLIKSKRGSGNKLKEDAWMTSSKIAD